jgi:hypothetical protein
MRITRCPACRRFVSGDLCACGLELAIVRAELAKLTQPETPIRWPRDVLAKCSPETRRHLIRVITRAHVKQTDGP